MLQLINIITVGIKFIVVTDHRQNKVEELLHKIYELYADYVLKNPFYSLDMPIKLAGLFVFNNHLLLFAGAICFKAT